jgi:hypothetical protein
MTSILLAQTTVKVCITAGDTTKCWPFTFTDKTSIIEFNCDKTTLANEESSTCTVMINQPIGLIGPPLVTVPAGSTSTILLIKRLDPLPVAVFIPLITEWTPRSSITPDIYLTFLCGENDTCYGHH